MPLYHAPARTMQNLGVIALLCAILGFAFYWWTPFGMVLSLAGLTLGVVGCILVTPQVSNSRLAWLVAGTLLSACALALNLFIATRGLETVRLMVRR